MWLKRNIPNALTLGNLLCGCLAILQVFEGDLVWAAYFVGIALVLDFFDGFTARLLKVSSPIGKDLDSLADMVTFGVVPGMVMFKIIGSARLMHIALEAGVDTTAFATDGAVWSVQYVAFVIPIFSCIRLARFNNDTRQSESFIGLPTPANAMVICSLPLFMYFPLTSSLLPPAGEIASLVNGPGIFWNPYFYVALTVMMSVLLVAELPLFALKFKGFSWADPQNRLRYVFLLLSLVLVICLQVIAIPLVILLYILFSIVNNLFIKKKG